MTVGELAVLLVQSEGKNPDRMYKGKQLWECKISLAEKIIASLPQSPKITDEKLMQALDKYVTVFNAGIPSGLGHYDNPHRMRDNAVTLHLNSLRAAVEVVLGN